MARGDKTRELGTRLDAVHTRLYTIQNDLHSELIELKDILAPKLLERLRSSVAEFDSANDDVQAIYEELDNVADELDSDESDDESDQERCEAELADARVRIAELENENDHLSAEED